MTATIRPAADAPHRAGTPRPTSARRGRAETVANVVAAVSVGLVLAECLLLLIRRRLPQDSELFLADAVLAVGLSAVATAIVRREPHNRLAWLFLVVGFGFAEYLFFSDLAATLDPGNSAYPYVAMIGYLGGEVGWPAVWLLAQIFPTGRPLSPRWTWVWRYSLTWWIVGLTSTAFADEVDEFRDFDNPWGLPVVDRLTAHIGPAVMIPVWSSIVALTLVSLGLRTLRASGLERAQLKVFFLGILPLPFAVIFLHGVPGGWLVMGLAALGWPLGMGAALLRHRLYEVDRVFSRTLAYLVVSGVLLTTYVLLVTVLSRLLPVTDTVGVVVAVVLTALLFDPLRRRVGRAVDRRFNRARVDAEAVVAAFAARARREFSVGAVRDDLTGTVRAALTPAETLVWVAPQRRAATPADLATARRR